MAEAHQSFDEILDGVDEWLLEFHKSRVLYYKALNDSFPLNLTLAMDSQELVNKYADQIYALQKSTTDKKRSSIKLIKKVISMLFANVRYSKSQYLTYSRDPGSYKKGYYNPNGIGYSVLLNVLDSLKELSLVDENYISKRSASKTRLRSRFKLNRKLVSEIKSIEVSSEPQPCDSILVKGKNKKLVELTNHSRKTSKFKTNLDKINDVLGGAEYAINGKPVGKPILRRIFNNGSLKYGGRFYSYGNFVYQALSKEERKGININGMRTIEVDFSGLHPTLLYSLQNLDLKGDPYEIEGEFDRSDLKKAFIVAINCSSSLGAYRAYSKHAEVPYGLAKQIVQQILKKHEAIKDQFFKPNLALKLQNMDSKIAEEVMLEFIKKSNHTPILPIHDSFIIPQKFNSLLTSIMKNVFFKHTNTHIEVH